MIRDFQKSLIKQQTDYVIQAQHKMNS